MRRKDSIELTAQFYRWVIGGFRFFDIYNFPNCYDYPKLVPFVVYIWDPAQFFRVWRDFCGCRDMFSNHCLFGYIQSSCNWRNRLLVIKNIAYHISTATLDTENSRNQQQCRCHHSPGLWLMPNFFRRTCLRCYMMEFFFTFSFAIFCVVIVDVFSVFI